MAKFQLEISRMLSTSFLNHCLTKVTIISEFCEDSTTNLEYWIKAMKMETN